MSETFQNATESAKKAGYNNRISPYLLIRQPQIKQRIEEIESAISSGIDWTKPVYEYETIKCYRELPATHTNKPKFLEMIGRIKGFFEPSSTNTFVFTGLDRDNVMSRITSIAHKITNVNMLQPIGSMNEASHNRDYRTLKAEEVSEAKGSEGSGKESVDLNLSTPPPVISNNSTPPPESLQNSHVPTSSPTPDEAVKVVTETTETTETAAEFEPTWSGCKHTFEIVLDKWTCSKCGLVHESE
jgi:hypothetical protein